MKLAFDNKEFEVTKTAVSARLSQAAIVKTLIVYHAVPCDIDTLCGAYASSDLSVLTVKNNDGTMAKQYENFTDVVNIVEAVSDNELYVTVSIRQV